MSQLYQIIPEDVAVRLVEAVNLALAMAERHAPHLLDEFDFTINRYKNTALSFRSEPTRLPSGCSPAFKNDKK